MPIRVLVVDDSGFYRRRLIAALSADRDIEIAGEAANGAEAIEQVKRLAPDVVTMDVSMPVMDGVSAVKRIMAEMPTPILMFSSLTTDGAHATLDALDAGAMDFLPKYAEDISGDLKQAMDQVCKRIRLLGTSGKYKLRTVGRLRATGQIAAEAVRHMERPPAVREDRDRRLSGGHFALVVIGCSTGGPIALQGVLSCLPSGFPIPTLVVQHMPGPFTKTFADRLNKICACRVMEAQHGDRLEPGVILVAPGGMQTTIKCRGRAAYVQVGEGDPTALYKPCLDVTLSSAALALPESVLGVVLTGMGADGKEGSGLLKARGSTVWVQDEKSSVVFGMPKAVIDAGYADQVMSVGEIGVSLARLS